jgi:hypothetical protein
VATFGGEGAVGSVIAGVAILAGIAGAFAGWNLRTARGANADLKVHKARIPGFRKVRNRTGMKSLFWIIGALLLLGALVRGLG